jgi:hypothetical protein
LLPVFGTTSKTMDEKKVLPIKAHLIQLRCILLA